MSEQFDIAYSNDHTDRRLIDLFTPEGQPNGAAIFFVHGGGFTAGDKAQWHDVCRHFAGLGYVCASAEYRLAPRWKFPAWVEDVRLGMAWFRRRAGECGFDPDRIAAAGSSAGGYLVLMLATIAPGDDLGRTDDLPEIDTRPNAVIAYCPAFSMHESRGWPSRLAYPTLMPAPESEAPELYRIASVEDRLCGDVPATLILHGTADELIPLSEALDLHHRIRATGAHVDLHALEGVGHGFGYGVKTDAQRESIERITEFLHHQLAGPAPE